MFPKRYRKEYGYFIILGSFRLPIMLLLKHTLSITNRNRLLSPVIRSVVVASEQANELTMTANMTGFELTRSHNTKVTSNGLHPTCFAVGRIKSRISFPVFRPLFFDELHIIKYHRSLHCHLTALVHLRIRCSPVDLFICYFRLPVFAGLL